MGYRITEWCRSPDGVLEFAVMKGGDGDVAIGFLASRAEPCLYGHTHPHIEAARWGVSEAEGVASYVEDVLQRRRLIAVTRVDGQISDVWLTENLDGDIRPDSPGETIEFRYWDGRPSSLV